MYCSVSRMGWATSVETTVCKLLVSADLFFSLSLHKLNCFLFCSSDWVNWNGEQKSIAKIVDNNKCISISISNLNRFCEVPIFRTTTVSLDFLTDLDLLKRFRKQLDPIILCTSFVNVLGDSIVCIRAQWEQRSRQLSTISIRDNCFALWHWMQKLS